MTSFCLAIAARPFISVHESLFRYRCIAEAPNHVSRFRKEQVDMHDTYPEISRFTRQKCRS
ncbi:predicted protein [Sclerotinia sclerotiorum 1980 UF-70]|uniref:Uncharacterized protein n=1 Tax=Sclerotinia sclerotiorum (strain ATCC 18683 / 1980 / Ss-1) TaxID=665079 RepID=A7EUV0_SCLS1|nr:predicted protein [Sclerotinia sclerotiorum 1980 UF-70]EDN93242.1 predicted protein [Sclerotinia sclerotiorum 1980 UF-70]